jgi:hypothetical protein
MSSAHLFGNVCLLIFARLFELAAFVF